MEQADTVGVGRAGGYDTIVLREIERPRNHTAFPGIVEDARIFASKLARLAEGGKF